MGDTMELSFQKKTMFKRIHCLSTENNIIKIATMTNALVWVTKLKARQKKLQQKHINLKLRIW